LIWVGDMIWIEDIVRCLICYI